MTLSRSLLLPSLPTSIEKPAGQELDSEDEVSVHYLGFGSKLPPETDTFGKFFKKSCTNCVFYFFWLGPQFVQNIKPIRQLLCTFSSCSDLGIYLIYNIYKFQENQRTKKGSLTFTSLSLSLHFTSLTTSWVGGRWRRLIVATEHCLLLLDLLSLTTNGSWAPACKRQGLGTVRVRLAGDGLKTVRARLAGNGLGTVRAGLARLIFLAVNPFKNQTKRKV